MVDGTWEHYLHSKLLTASSTKDHSSQAHFCADATPLQFKDKVKALVNSFVHNYDFGYCCVMFGERGATTEQLPCPSAFVEPLDPVSAFLEPLDDI